MAVELLPGGFLGAGSTVYPSCQSEAQGRTISGEPITIPPKTLGNGARYAVGGTIFGLGWALTGACPGPFFALVGDGVTVMIVAIVSAKTGTWLYGFMRRKLPH